MKSGRSSVRVTAQASRKVEAQIRYRQPHSYGYGRRPVRYEWHDDPDYVRNPGGQFSSHRFDPEEFPGKAKRPKNVRPGARPQAPEESEYQDAPESEFDFVEAYRGARSRGYNIGSDIPYKGLGFGIIPNEYAQSGSRYEPRSRGYYRPYEQSQHAPAVSISQARVQEVIPSIQDVKAAPAPLSQDGLDQLERQIQEQIKQLRSQVPAEDHDTPEFKALIQRLWLVYDIALLRYHHAKNPTPVLEQRINEKEQEFARLSGLGSQPTPEVVPSSKRAPAFESPAAQQAPVTDVGAEPEPESEPDPRLKTSMFEAFAQQVRRRAREAQKRGEANKAKALADLADKIRSGYFPFNDVVSGLVDTEYNKLRMVRGDQYFRDPELRTPPDIDRLTEVSTDDIKVVAKNKWHYRVPAGGYKKGDAKERYSLNVRGDPALIKALDAFVAQTGAYYKTPDDGTAWGDRHDPVTVYADAGLSREERARLGALAQPYVRSTAPMPGIRVKDGVYREISPSRQDIADIYARAGALGLRSQIQSWTRSKGSTERMSTGQRTALEAFLTRAERQAGVEPTLSRPPPLPSKRAPVLEAPIREPMDESSEQPAGDLDIPMEEPVEYTGPGEAPATATEAPAESKQVGGPPRGREPHILVIDPEGTMESRLVEMLRNQDLRATWASTFSEIGSILQNDPPVGVALAAELGGVSPQQVIDGLRPYIGDQAPIIILGSAKPGQEIRSIQEAKAAGANHFFKLPTNNAYLAFKLKNMMGSSALAEAPEAVAEPEGPAELGPEEFEQVDETPAVKMHTVLIVDPKRTLGKGVDAAFKAEGLNAVVVADPDEVGNVITSSRPNAVIIATDLGGESAEQAIKVIRANPQGETLPVLLAGTGAQGQRIRTMRDATRAGADYMFNLPANASYMARQVKKWVTRGPSPSYAEDPEEVTPVTAEEIAQIERAITSLNTRAAQLINKAMRARKEGRKDEAKRIFAKVKEQSAQISKLEEELARLTAAMESAKAAEEPEMVESPAEPASSGQKQWQIRGPKPTKLQRPRGQRRRQPVSQE